MSLLMDALRRAETSATDTGTDAIAPVQESSVPVEKDETCLTLEPLSGAAPQTETPAENKSDLSAPPEPSVDIPPVTKPAAEPEADKPDRIILAPHSAGTHNTLMFGSGFIFILLVVGGYYALKSSQLPESGHIQSATLISTPVPHADNLSTAAQNNLVEKPETVSVQTVTTSVANKKTSPATQPRLTEAAPAHETERRPAPPIRISKKRNVPSVNPQLNEAYHAYRQQNFAHAESLYRQVLRRYPDNRDAALGLAAIAMYQNRPAEARYYYEHVLKTHPRDNVARVALQSLSGSGDALKDSSQLKHWLQSNPDDPQLHFALGNHHAESGNWKEAQRAYFEAFHLAPTRADYAFNLAIALDQLGLRTQALNYYRKARELAGHTALFNIKQLEQRIAQLAKTGGPGS